MRRLVFASSIGLAACQAFLVLDSPTGQAGGTDAGPANDAGADTAAVSPSDASTTDETTPPPPPNDGGELLDGGADPFCATVAKENKGEGLTTAYCSSAPRVGAGSGLVASGSGKFAVDVTSGYRFAPSLVATPGGFATAPATAPATARITVVPSGDLTRVRVRVSAMVQPVTALAISFVTVTTKTGSVALTMDAQGQVAVATDGAAPINTTVMVAANTWHSYELVIDSQLTFRADTGGLDTIVGASAPPLTGPIFVDVGSGGATDAYPVVAIDDLAVSFKP